MSRHYDLHSHSTASDGTLTPTELVQAAAEAGVDILALTDHDELDGIAEAQAEAQRQGITVIPGVEVSVTWRRRTVHIVGLGVDPADETLNAGLARLREFRDWRAEEMGRRLAKHRIEGAYEGAKARCNGRILSRTHFAHWLAANGYGKTVADVFRHYLKPNKPGYVAGEWASMEEALGWIRGAGGQAVIAHPARYPLTATKLRELVGEFIECGGEGLEVVSGSHTPNDYRHMAQVAKRFDLAASAGSDYHGPEHPWIRLGRLPALPEGCRPIWHDWTTEAGQNDVRRAV